MTDDLETTITKEEIEVAGPEVIKMAGDVDSVPVLAEEQKLPAGCVRYLDDQPSAGLQDAMRSFEV